MHDHPPALPKGAGKLPDSPTRKDVDDFLRTEVNWLNKTRRR
jgi:hypothetical protein